MLRNYLVLLLTVGLLNSCIKDTRVIDKGGAGASGISYPLNGTPLTTDQLLGIDDPAGTWAINRFGLADLPLSDAAVTESGTKADQSDFDTLETAVGLNTSKNTNVSTTLSVGTVGTTTVAITSDGGADDVTLPAATNAAAGISTAAQVAAIEANTSKVTEQDSGTNTGDDPADDTAYNATSWDSNTDAATKNAIRDKIEAMGGGSGDVVGPGSAVDGNIATFDGVTGKLLKDSGASIDSNGIATPASTSPGFTMLDSDAPGTDKEIGGFYGQYIDGADGSENADWFLRAFQAGSATDIIQYDESDDQIEMKKVVGFEGGFKALTPVTDDADNFAANFTGENLYGGTFIANGTGTSALPSPVEGMHFCIKTKGAIAVVVEPDTGDSQELDGVALDANDSATNLSTAGDIICYQYLDATTWDATSNNWTDED